MSLTDSQSLAVARIGESVSGNTIAALLPNIAARLGVGTDTSLQLPTANRYVLLLIDGLGAQQLAQYATAAPTLSAWIKHDEIALSSSFTSGLPSTTATSLTSLGTGLSAGQHGIAGYSFRYPQFGSLNVLRWPKQLSAIAVQSQLTYFERMQNAGIGCTVLAPKQFADSGLTQAALRGAAFWSTDENGSATLRATKAALAASSCERSFTYVYERALDHAGHSHGIGSAQWIRALSQADQLAEALRSALPTDAVLLVSADHGMVDVPATNHIAVEDHPEMLQGVELIAGEGRFRHIYTPEPEAVAMRWQNRLATKAQVLQREQADTAGWFGEIQSRFASHFGDVVVAMEANYALMTRTLPGEFHIKAMHGSFTPAEIRIPLLIA